MAVAAVFGTFDYQVMRRNLFTLKRRSIRLNRKTRRIYAIRTKNPDGTGDAYLVDEKVEYQVKVNGKVRGRVVV
ncbi:hypothetical protein K4H02_28020, partial [Mycobacterium tuberculosis]|nr:hypothetical protein [Mycobacterium tuberculosis]